MSTRTFTRCSSTPRADTLVKPLRSTADTRPLRDLSPPQPSMEASIPGTTPAASAENRSASPSRSSGSPTSRRGVPACTGLALSSKTFSTYPSTGERTRTGSEGFPFSGPCMREDRACSASNSAMRRANSAAFTSLERSCILFSATSQSCFAMPPEGRRRSIRSNCFFARS